MLKTAILLLDERVSGSNPVKSAIRGFCLKARRFSEMTGRRSDFR
jgi:hypothetical protein